MNQKTMLITAGVSYALFSVSMLGGVSYYGTKQELSKCPPAERTRIANEYVQKWHDNTNIFKYNPVTLGCYIACKEQ